MRTEAISKKKILKKPKSAQKFVHSELTRIDIGLVTGADYNPRVMPDSEMNALMASIREFGFVQPVVVRKEDLLILGGHQRVAAYKRLVAEDGTRDVMIPAVLVSNISDAKAKLLNVALNRISGDWDYSKLGQLFVALGGDDADLTLTGFTSREIEDIIQIHTEERVVLPPEMTEQELSEALAVRSRSFTFTCASDMDAQFAQKVLGLFGMTSAANASKAFIKALQAAHARIGEA
jgi:ParB-like chromosome segregation protein Spo0J